MAATVSRSAAIKALESMGYHIVKEQGGHIILVPAGRGDHFPVHLQAPNGEFEYDRLIQTLAEQGVDMDAFERNL